MSFWTVREIKVPDKVIQGDDRADRRFKQACKRFLKEMKSCQTNYDSNSISLHSDKKYSRVCNFIALCKEAAKKHGDSFDEKITYRFYVDVMRTCGFKKNFIKSICKRNTRRQT